MQPIAYTVHMVNFDMMNKGVFYSLEQAVELARALGFECAIYLGANFICSVKPY